MAHLILTATYTNDIVTLAFDDKAGTLETVSSTAVGYHPSWLTFYPGDRSLVFAGLEQTDGRIVALKYDHAGKGTVVAETSSGGADPCSLTASKTHLYVANYGGSVACIPISPSPPYIITSMPPVVVCLEGLNSSGPNPARQESPHPHQVVLLEQDNELLVPDLGADVLRRFGISQDTTSLIAHDFDTFVKYTPGGGPRHIILHDGYLYTLLELTSVLEKHRFPSTSNTPSLITSTPTMSNPPPPPTDMLAAELLLPAPNPTFPTPMLYISNRNDPSPLGDIISIFDPSTLELIAEVRSGLDHLRGMAFGPEGRVGADRWLVAGGANGGGVKVWERVDEGRGLVVVAECEGVEGPTGFLWM